MSIRGNYFAGYNQQFIQTTFTNIEKANNTSPNGSITSSEIGNFLKKQAPGTDSYKAAKALSDTFSQLDVNQNGKGGNDGIILMGDVSSYSAKHQSVANSPAPSANNSPDPILNELGGSPGHNNGIIDLLLKMIYQMDPKAVINTRTGQVTLSNQASH